MTLPDFSCTGQRQTTTPCSKGPTAHVLGNHRRISWAQEGVATVVSRFEARRRAGLPVWGCLVASYFGLLSLALGFDIKVVRNSEQRIRIEFPTESSSYHQILTAADVTGPWAVVAVLPATQGILSWTCPEPLASGNAAAFFRVLRIPRAHPLDADKDGMDDLYELKWNFLDPLNATDARQDQDQDGLLNVGEYQLGTDPTAQDSDLDWACDGYEVSKGTSPISAASSPPLEFRLNGGSLYATNAAISLDFGPFVADTVDIAESPRMAGAINRPLKKPVPFSFQNSSNGLRSVYVRLRRVSDGAVSPILSRSIVLDTVRPKLSVADPPDGVVTARRFVKVQGTVTDNIGPARVRIDGTWAETMEGGSFRYGQVILHEGSNVVEVVAEDAAGNTATYRVRVVRDSSIDTVSPAVVFDLPRDYVVLGGITNYIGTSTFGSDSELLLHGHSDDETATIALRVLGAGGVKATATASIFGTQIWARVPLFQGTNVLTAVASDAAGNSSTNQFTVIRDPKITLKITDPGELQLINGSATYVSGIASTAFSNAVITVNGNPTDLTLKGANLFFRTRAPVPLPPGLSELKATAVLNGRTYHADPAVRTYEALNCHHLYTNDYNSLYYSDYCDRFTVNGHWVWDDQWSEATAVLSERRIKDVTECSYILGSTDCNTDTSDNTSLTQHTQQKSGAFFGLESLWYDYQVCGHDAWERDLVRVQDRVEVRRDSLDKYEGDLAVIEFDNLGYKSPRGFIIDPSQVTYRNQRGFYCGTGVGFVTALRPGESQVISEEHFTWPVFTYVGPRTDVRPWYPEETTTMVHILRFDAVSLHPVIKKMPLGTPAALSRNIIGKVWAPTKWGGELEFSGAKCDVYYTGGGDLDCGQAAAILRDELPACKLPEIRPGVFSVPEGQHGWYYVQALSDTTTSITSTFTQEGRAATLPWNGWYWPFLDGTFPNLYDETGPHTPLAKYDRVYGTTERQSEAAYVDPSTHRWMRSDAKEWEGHCWGWSLAAVARSQPAATTKTGFTFDQDEMEGLYTELAEGATCGWTWRVGTPNVQGSPATEIPAGPPTDLLGEPADAWPGKFHNALEQYLRQQKKPMNGNLRDQSGADPSQVWNHDVYAYKSTMSEAAGGNERIVTIETTITSNVDVGSMPADSDTREDTYWYVIEYQADGTIDVSSQNQNWLDCTGFLPACLGTVEVLDWQGGHCTITKDNVDGLYP